MDNSTGFSVGLVFRGDDPAPFIDETTSWKIDLFVNTRIRDGRIPQGTNYSVIYINPNGQVTRRRFDVILPDFPPEVRWR